MQPEKAESPISVTLDGIFVFLHPATRVLLAVSIIPLQFSLLSYFAFPSDTFRLSKLLQPQNALSSISVTLNGISTLVKPMQPSKAKLPISVTLDGISTLIKPMQPSKAEPHIPVILDGIFVFLHPNTRVLLAVSIIPLQFSLLSYFAFPSDTFRLSKLLQPPNAPLSIFITLDGISTLVKPLQFRKALKPIFVTSSPFSSDGTTTSPPLPTYFVIATPPCCAPPSPYHVSYS